MMFSCNPPVIKEPVTMYVVTLKFNEAGFAPKQFDYRKEKEVVGEWTEELQFISLDQAPENMTCFTTEDWLTIVKPTLKEVSVYYHQNSKKKRKFKKPPFQLIKKLN